MNLCLAFGSIRFSGDRDEGAALCIESLAQADEVGERAGEAIDLVDDDTDAAGLDLGEEPLQRRAFNRAENSHLPFRRRERAMLRFRRMRSLQKFASVHSSSYNHFHQERALASRPNFKLNHAAALVEWRGLLAA